MRLPAALGRHLLFYLAFIAATQVREYSYEVLDQAVMWLPTGVAVAGLWLLGARAAWVVALGAVTQRTLIGYDLSVAASAGAGSAAEALVGLLLLRRLGYRPRLERLRDVLAVCVAAVVAPAASVLCSWLARGFLWSNPDIAFYSGWGGWWRMNALGLLAVVPVSLAWLAPSRAPGLRAEALPVAIVALAQALLVAIVIVLGPQGVAGIMLVNLTLLAALYAAVRHGPRAAVTAGSLAAVVIAVGTTNGLGPFLSVPTHERHLTLQLLELLMIGLPLVFGALVAERRAAEAEGRRAGAELAENRALLEAIHRNANEGLYRSRPDGALLYANQAFADLFGFADPQEALVANAFGLHANPERRRDLMDTIARTGFITGEEVEFRRRDGSTFWGRVSSTTVRGLDGSVLSYDGAIADVTARRQLEERLRQSQRLESVGQLAGGIAHDFNNVLTAIVGYAELIRASSAAHDPVQGHAGGVLRAAERAAALTRQLLAYSRRQVLSPQVLELGSVVQQLGEMLRRLIGEHIQLRIDTDPRGSWSLVDRSQLEQVIVNLVVNARDAMPDGGDLLITIASVGEATVAAGGGGQLRDGPHIRLQVADTGVGMDEAVRTRAFDPFFTTKDRGKGTGLGLSTVYGIVQQSGGDVYLDSRPGQGTTVTVCLPQVAPAAAPEPAPPAPTLAPATATILVAEDEAAVRELAAEFLARAGFTVLPAVDGQDALDLAAHHGGAIDVLVTDVVMPRLGGRELAHRLLADHPRTRVLFISGYTDDAGDLRGLAPAGCDFLQKPFGPESLVARVRALLGASAAGTA